MRKLLAAGIVLVLVLVAGVARFQAIEGKTWNHPIVSNGRLLVRNLQEMAAFDVRPR